MDDERDLIEVGFWDGSGRWREATEEARRALLDAMRPSEALRRRANIRFVRQGESTPIAPVATLVTEDGAVLSGLRELPRDLPLGYHRLRPQGDEEETLLIVSPRTCYLPEALRAWGWGVQLYALRSRQSWGMGDLADLRELGRFSSQTLGASMLMINPLHAPMPIPEQQPSPYFPSSRIFRNPLYLRIEEVPGAERLGPNLEPLARRGRALLNERHIRRDEIFRLKMDALESLWRGFGSDPSFERYCEEQGDLLRSYATYCTLAEMHGGSFRHWPEELRSPASAAVARIQHEQRDRIRFHQWVQWLIDEQLAAARAAIPLISDLAVGADPHGADAWLWQEYFARDVAVGAPPDEFNSGGQDWGVAPFIPGRLREGGYEPFIRLIRSALRHAAGVRLDHVMGLFRLFWIPKALGAHAGTYVRYRADELLDIVALESHRAKAYVIGEDLGTVEDLVRRELFERKILSYKVMWFEERTPAEYPVQALASVTTHDLPTIPGMWSGSDFRTQQSLGIQPSEDSARRLRERFTRLVGSNERATADDVVLAAYEALARAPSAVLAATLDDALGVEERPNMPGTTSEYPSWSIALPKLLEDIEDDPRIARVARALSR